MSDLARIERYAARIVADAQSLRQSVRMVRTQPDFETRAEDVMKTATAELERTLATVRQALSEFNHKPVAA